MKQIALASLWVAVLFAGLSGIMALSDRAVQAGPEVFPPGTTLDTLTATADTELQEASPTSNVGTANSFGITRGTGTTKIAVIKFDLSSIPSGDAIIAAHIRLARTAKAATGLDSSVVGGVFRVTKDWTEADACWDSASTGVTWGTSGMESRGARGYLGAALEDSFNTSGYDRMADPVATFTLPSTVPTSSVELIEVTRLVDQWVSGQWENQGLALDWLADQATCAFNSVQATTAADRPKLIVYHAPVGTPLTVGRR